MIKTGILGGTFDPFHFGHLNIAKAALEKFSLDELWIMPNGRPPHKNSETITASVTQRLEMLESIVSLDERFVLCRYEAERTEISYSYQTMEHFNLVYPERHFFFIIGGDSLDMLHTWYHPELLLKSCTILVAVRNNKSFTETQKQIDTICEKYQADMHLLEVPEFPVSSSEIREWIRNNETDDTLNKYMPDSILSYIRDNNLYMNRGPIHG